jgi:hypothetical protein
MAILRELYTGGQYAEAVEKSFKVVRDRLRSLTTYETGSEAFGKGKLYVEGAAPSHVDDDFQNGLSFSPWRLIDSETKRATLQTETSPTQSALTSICASAVWPCTSWTEV